MHRESRVSSAISVCDNERKFNKGFTPVAVAPWVGCGSSSPRVCTLELRAEFFFANDFYFSFVRPNGLQ